MVRGLCVVAAVISGLVLGTVQFVAMAVYGDLARAPSVPSLLSPAFGFSLAVALGVARAPAVVQTAYARALLHRGERSAAAATVVRLPLNAASAELRGQLAEVNGHPAQALRDYATAGDDERAQRLIDARADARDFEAAARLEASLVDALAGGGQATVRARALWRLGQITQSQAAADPAHAGRRERESLDLYERALAIAPNEETYLLAAGQQALTIGDLSAAARYYTRALESVPNSADARAGLARAQR